jgi:diamine N-acetyltransferase
MAVVAAAPRILRADADAIPTVMRFERMPGYEALVGRWSEAEHRAALAEPGTVYLLGHEDGGPRGFAILRGLDDPNGDVLLKRIAVEAAGQGFGGRFLDATIAWVFTATAAHRLWLEVFAHNSRARHVYARAGFSADGVPRETYRLTDGERVTELTMALLRAEWDARRPAQSPADRVL